MSPHSVFNSEKRSRRMVLFPLFILVIVFFNYSPYPSSFMRITFKAEWNDVRWALYRPFSYEKIGVAISTVGTFEAWRSISWCYVYWNSWRVFCHILSNSPILRANHEEDQNMANPRIYHCSLLKLRLLSDYTLKKLSLIHYFFLYVQYLNWMPTYTNTINLASG